MASEENFSVTSAFFDGTGPARLLVFYQKRDAEVRRASRPHLTHAL